MSHIVSEILRYTLKSRLNPVTWLTKFDRIRNVDRLNRILLDRWYMLQTLGFFFVFWTIMYST